MVDSLSTIQGTSQGVDKGAGGSGRQTSRRMDITGGAGGLGTVAGWVFHGCNSSHH